MLSRHNVGARRERLSRLLSRAQRSFDNLLSRARCSENSRQASATTAIHVLAKQRVSRRIWNEFLPCTVMDVVPRGETGVTRGHLARTLVLLRCDDVDPPKDRLSTHLVNT